MMDERDSNYTQVGPQSETVATGAKMATQPGGSKDDEALLELIAERIKSARCILFLGSGVHRPPGKDSPYVYKDEECPPVGPGLARLLAAKSHFKQKFPDPSESEDNLMRVSQHYELNTFRQTLIEEIHQACQEGKQPSAVVRALARLDFPLVITTNYDRLYESALQQANKGFARSIYDPERMKIEDCRPQLRNNQWELEPKKPFILKVHGDIETPRSIVVTDEDYVRFVARMSDKDPNNPVPKNVRALLSRWSTLFIGYSLRDYNLRLLFNTLRWRIDAADIPACYSIDLRPDPLIFEVYHDKRRYIKFIKQDMWTIVPRLYKKVTGEEMPK